MILRLILSTWIVKTGLQLHYPMCVFTVLLTVTILITTVMAAVMTQGDNFTNAGY